MVEEVSNRPLVIDKKAASRQNIALVARAHLNDRRLRLVEKRTRLVAIHLEDVASMGPVNRQGKR